MDYIGLLKEIKTHLQTDANLTYIENVTIRKHPTDPPQFPSFDKYCILISPFSRQNKLIALRAKQLNAKVDVVCVMKNFDQELSIIGNTLPNIGIIKMIDDVEESLFVFGENNLESLEINYDEMTEGVDFKTKFNKEREAFFHEHALPYKVKFKKKTF
jgi:hypothetical protein